MISQGDILWRGISTPGALEITSSLLYSPPGLPLLVVSVRLSDTQVPECTTTNHG
jgi:hypothetical protein